MIISEQVQKPKPPAPLTDWHTFGAISTWTKLGYIYYEGKIPTFERNLLNRRNFLNITYFSPTTYVQHVHYDAGQLGTV